MANNEIQLKIDTILDTKGADVSYKGMVKQIKELNTLALQYKGTNSEAFDLVNKKAADLKGELDDVKDSMRALDGSQVESLNNSFSLLQEGVGNLDFTKATTSLNILTKTTKNLNFKSLTEGVGGFVSSLKTLSTAILSNPILLLAAVVVAIVAALYKLKDGGGAVTKMFDVMSSALKYVTDLFKELLDFIGLTDFAGTEKSKNTIANAEKEKAALEERYNTEMALLKATGATSQEIFNREKQHFQEQIANNQKIINSLHDRKVAGIQLNEEQKKQLDEAEKAHREYVDAVKILEAERKKAIEDANTAIDKTIEDLRVKRTKSQVDDIQLAAARQKKAISEGVASEEKKAELIIEIDKDAQLQISKYYAEQSKIRADKATAAADKSKNEKITILNDELKQVQQLRAIDTQQLDLKKEQDVEIAKDGIDLELSFYKNLTDEQKKLMGLSANDLIEIELRLSNEKKAIQTDYDAYVTELKTKQIELDKQNALKIAENTIANNNYELDRLGWLFENKHIKASEYFDKTEKLLLSNLETEKNILLSNTQLTEQQRLAIENEYANKRKKIEEDVNKQKVKSQTEALQQGIMIAGQFVNVISGLNDMITANENSRLKDGEKASIAVQRKQFKRKQNMEVAQANINAGAATAAIWGQYATQPVVAALLTVAAAATFATTIAKIKNTKFNPESAGAGDSGGSISGGGSTPNVSNSIPAIQSFNTGRTPTPQPPNGGPDSVEVWVSEYDISNTQRKVNVYENRARF